MSSSNQNGIVLFSIDDELCYTGINQSFLHWVREQGFPKPVIGEKITLDDKSAKVLSKVGAELKTQPSTLKSDCSALLDGLEFQECIVNSGGESCSVTLCFASAVAQKKAGESPFFNLSKDLFSITDFNNHFVELNMAWEDLLGYTIEELKARPFHDFLHPDDYKRLQELLESQEENQEFMYLINRYRRKDGEYVWLEWKASIDYENELSYAVARDVTQLQNNEIRLQHLADSVPGALLQYRVYPDGSDEVPYISEQVEKLWGVSREEALANTQSLWKVIHEDDIPGMQASIEQSAKDMSFWDYSWRILTKEGMKWLNGRGYPRKLADGGILWDTLILDISRLKKVEQNLTHTNRRLELAANASNMGIWELDPKSSELIWNDAMHDIYEVSKADFRNQVEVPLSLVHPEDQQAINDAMDRLLNGEILTDYRFRIKTPSGRIKHLEAHSSVLKDDHNQIVKLIGVNEDITDFIDKEKKLEETIAQKEMLFRELHHRIKNNLNLVSSFLYIKSTASKDEQLLEFIKEINGRIISIAKTHDQLLKLEEVDKLYSESYLCELVNTLCNTYAQHPEQYELKFDIENHKMPVDHLLTLGLIANEVVSNIVKHAYPIEEGGPIEIIFKKAGDSYTMQICDKGNGSEEDLKGNSQSLGLQLIDLLVKQLKGTLERSVDGGVSYKISYSITN